MASFIIRLLFICSLATAIPTPLADGGMNIDSPMSTCSSSIDGPTNCSPTSAVPSNFPRDLAIETTSTIPSPASTSALVPRAEDLCSSRWEFFFDRFHIHGKDFDPSLLGDHGSGLKHQIEGCGALTDWKFKTLTKDPNGYQWEASGDVPILNKECIGSAVIAAGGSSLSGCQY